MAAVSADEAKAGVALIAKHYTINADAKVAGTNKPLDKHGAWSMRAAQPAERTSECGADDAVCRVVTYRVGQPETVCTWTLLSVAGGAPRVVQENEFARSLLLRTIQADDKPLPRLAQSYNAIMPGIARAAHQYGDVHVLAIVNERGEITDTAILSGSPMLQGAAVDAIRHWRFEPLLLDGKGQAFREVITFSFNEDSATDNVPRK